ncbi:MAG: glycosyltransferase [Halioglobus sp.]
MKRVMLVTNQLAANTPGGRAQLCALNYEALKSIYGSKLVIFQLPKRGRQGVLSFFNAFRGHIDGVTARQLSDLVSIVRENKIEKIFVDGSNLGEVVRVVKKNISNVEVTTFFHNVEARFFLGSFRTAKTLRSIGVLIANYLAERKSVKYSDKIICLSDRDSALLKSLYGRAATHTSAMAMQDRLPAVLTSIQINVEGKYALFVGGDFYANRSGISWYIEHVVPYISIPTYIVGRGLEDLEAMLKSDGKVKVVGAVDDVAEWYLGAQFVVAPIFDGSGMKTKVAEALMFGKKVVGTREAFSGYEDVADEVGWECETARDFIVAIEQAQSMIVEAFDPQLRQFYEKLYSYSAARVRIAKIIDEID